MVLINHKCVSSKDDGIYSRLGLFLRRIMYLKNASPKSVPYRADKNANVLRNHGLFNLILYPYHRSGDIDGAIQEWWE